MIPTQIRNPLSTVWPSMTVIFVVGLVATIALTRQPAVLGVHLQQTLSWSAFELTSVRLLVGIGALLLVEHLLPAQLTNQGIKPSILGDAAYTFAIWPITLAIITTIRGPFDTFLETYLGWMTLDIGQSWPAAVTAVLALTVNDFVAWGTHVIKHKVPLLWRFHIVHHSQTRMNAFTANRVHPIESIQDLIIQLLPLFVLFPSFAQSDHIVYMTAFYVWWTRFQHTNIRTNLGPLRYILVTPQSHRIHHSTQDEHWNSNYANIFSIWDRLFGLQHRDSWSYPGTGVDDPEFPEVDRWSISSFCRGWIGQMHYPFRRDVM